MPALGDSPLGDTILVVIGAPAGTSHSRQGSILLCSHLVHPLVDACLAAAKNVTHAGDEGALSAVSVLCNQRISLAIASWFNTGPGV